MLFLASTELDDIMEVCNYAPEFIPIYQEVFEFGKDVKELVGTFSDSLRETDRNAERIMVEELQKELKIQKAELREAYAEIERLRASQKDPSAPSV